MRIFLTLLLSLFIVVASAQNSWTLQDCMKQANKENLSIKQQELGSKISRSNLIQSKFDLMPSLNVYGSQGYNFGRAIDPLTNDFTEDNTQSNNFSLSSSLTLFSGFQKVNTIRKNNLDFLASLYDVQQTRNDISLSVANAFLEILYNKELVEVGNKQLLVSQLQVERISKMLAVGKVAKGALLETESQLIAEELQLINAQNQLLTTTLNMQQLLELKYSTSFDVEIPEINISVDKIFPTTDLIFEKASQVFPEVSSAELKLKSSKRTLTIAKGRMSPQISLNSSLGTGYTDARMDFSTGEDVPFKNQIRDNLSKSLTLSLNIPIFNSWYNNTAVSQSKIGIQQAENNLLQTRNQLRKQIEQARADVLAAQKQYQFAVKSGEALGESFRYVEQKYVNGLANTYEYNDAKSKLFKSESELVRAKYDYLFKMKIIDFYMGHKLTL